MSTIRPYCFNAGPATLPYEVLKQIQDNFFNFNGLSVLEISHRSKEFDEIIAHSKALFIELMNIPDNYEILFLQGGASHQFAMIPLNLMDKSADYVITGHWSKRAYSEAKIIGDAKIIFTSEYSNFSNVPKSYQIQPTPNASYVHITTNNTIYGTEFHEIPDTHDIPLIADMSSDILSRPVDVSKFGLIYAGAQKNIGPAGATLVIIRKDLIAKSYRNLPNILKYSTHAENNSLYNTPPVFAIYTMFLVLQWIKKNGGLKELEKINIEKAQTLYNEIDASCFYKPNAQKESRSNMNITFTLPNDDLTQKFIQEAKERNITGIKGIEKSVESVLHSTMQ